MGLRNSRLCLSGTVIGVPVPTGENRVFTVEVSAFLRKEKGTNLFSDFKIHCVMAGKVRWGNAFVPRLGRGVMVLGEVIGWYDRPRSLCIMVDQFSPLPQKDKGTETIVNPSTDGQSTPKYVLSSIVSLTSTNLLI